MEPVTAYLGLGSNLGQRDQNLAQAISLLGEKELGESSVEVLRVSSVYETAPWGLTGQPDFLNCVAEVATRQTPGQLLDYVKQIEGLIGREPGPRWGPRAVDLDILLYGDWTVDEIDLHIPHSLLHERAFVIIPLAELAPALIHPELRVSLEELCLEVDGKDGVQWWGPPPSPASKTA